MPTREVLYELEIHDELPEQEPVGGNHSPLENQLKAVVNNPDHHAPKWARIGRYRNSPAANSAKAVLLKRHGDTAEVEGFRFETRRIDNGTATGLFVQYDPERIVPGLREKNAEMYRTWMRRQREARDQAKAEKAAAEAKAAEKATKTHARADS